MRILVVEDEPDLRELLTRLLRSANYAVDAAVDGEDAWCKASSWTYDAIVLDLMLPKLDGWQFLERLRRTYTVPVLILTARDALDDRVRGLDQGADDYVVKPFEASELLARVRAVVRRGAAKASSRIELGNVVLDTAARTALRDNQPVVLTAREYALVELLALRRGELVTRTMIYDHLFDETDDSLSNLVEVHVSNVRKKLGKDFITTRRGQGYVIDG